MVAKADSGKGAVWHAMSVTKRARAERHRQKPYVVWFTGLSGSGKSSIADILEQALFSQGYSTYLLDGDNIRHGLSRDLGFSDSDRVENMRRIGEVVKLFLDAGCIVIASFISPFRRERQMVKELLHPEEFVEVYVSTPLGVCEHRDRKGLYAKARSGQLRNFTGIDSPYEPPVNASVELDMSEQEPEEALSLLLQKLRELGLLL